MAAKFELFKDADGKFRFRLKAANGEIIASSEGYKSKAGAENGIKSVKTNAPGAAVVDKTQPTVPTEPEEKRQRTHEEIVEIQRKLNVLARKYRPKLIKTEPTVPTEPEEKRQRTHEEIVEIQRKLNVLARKYKPKIIK